MKSLPANLIVEKNKIATGSAWLILLDVILDDGATTLYFVNNTEDILFLSNTYTAIAFDLDSTSYSTKGEIPSLQLRISNVTRLIQAYLEALDGAVGDQVRVRVVNSEHLTEDYTELEMLYDILVSESNAEWVTFTLGAPNPLRSRFPKNKYISFHCNWIFKEAECAYVGAETQCNRTLEACTAYNNAHRFGGHPGLKAGGLRVA